MNIVAIIRQATSRLPTSKIALRSESGELTYGELFDAVDGVAVRLLACGIGRHRRVGLAFPDGADYIIISLAILSLDAVLVPVPVSCSREVAEDMLEKTSADFFLAPQVSWAAEARRIDTGWLASHRGFSLVRRPPGRPLPEAFANLEPAFVRFSSGTTGSSKGVLLTHPAILERTEAADQALKITSADTILWVLSMSFHFVVSILLFLRRGATIWLTGEAFPFSFLSAVKGGGGTFIYATPFHYRTLTESRELNAAALTDVRMAISTAMKLPSETARGFRDMFGFSLSEAYGIIEVGLPFVNAAEAKPSGSVGQALPGYELEIRSPDADGVGTVLIRGPGMYSAYLYPWRVRKADEWFDTGDLGRLDDDGFLYLLGRSKDVINFAGMKVFPYEVEAVVNDCPGVRASRVYAEEHPHYGQLPCLQIEAGDEVTADQVLRHCYRQLVSYKVPKKIVFVRHLERTASGKIKR